MRWMRAVYRSVQLQQPRPPAFHNIVDGFSLKKGRLLTCVLATRAGKRWTLFKRPQSAHSPSHFEKKKKKFVPLLPPRCQTHWRVCLDECEAAVAVTRVVSGSLAAIILLRVRCPPNILEGFEQLLLLSAGRHTGADAADWARRPVGKFIIEFGQSKKFVGDEHRNRYNYSYGCVYWIRVWD